MAESRFQESSQHQGLKEGGILKSLLFVVYAGSGDVIGIPSPVVKTPGSRHGAPSKLVGHGPRATVADVVWLTFRH